MFCPLHWYTHTITALHSFNEPLYILWIFLKKTIHWLRHYHKKEGKFSFCFGRIIISTIRLFSFIDPHKVIGWVLLTIHLHYLLFVLKIWLKINSPLPLQASLLSDYGESLFALFFALIHSWNYVVTYIWLTSFILSIFCKHNLYWFCRYHRKRVSLFFF